MKDSVKSKIVVAARILLGLVFVFSGYVKAVDPLGSTYKIQDYMAAMGLDFFAPIALVIGIALAAFEFLIGVCLVLGTNLKSTSILAFVMMCFMTPLTLWIAIADPVTDCGCFGDALVISNWQTFWKNIVLLALTILVYKWKEYSPKLFSNRTEWLIAICAGTFSILLSIYCYFNLPIIDFRPYKNGTDIIKAMEVPEGAEEDEFETILVYEKDGEQKEFSLDNYPKDDNSWTFVDSKHKLIKKGFEPPIHDFTMEHPDDGDITEEVLNKKGYTFLMVCYRVEKALTNKRKEINNIYQYAQQNGYDFYCMTATGLETDEMKEFKTEMGYSAEGGYPIVNTDEITLKTIVRSNPGLVLLKDGVVVNKWSNKNLPKFEKPLDQSEMGKVQEPNEWGMVTMSVLGFLAVLALVFAIDWIISRISGKKK
ncbi:MAG: DoxX family protein [Paludibacteraceae bacterium]|nr:DoxX family protein [Paludibacteraceae bacterium]